MLILRLWFANSRKMSYFPFCYIALIGKMGWTPTAKTALTSCVTFSLAIHACISSGCIAMVCILASSIASAFSATFSSVRLGSCKNRRRKRLGEHLSMNWSRISLLGLANSHVDASLRSLVTKVSDDPSLA